MAGVLVWGADLLGFKSRILRDRHVGVPISIPSSDAHVLKDFSATLPFLRIGTMCQCVCREAKQRKKSGVSDVPCKTQRNGNDRQFFADTFWLGC